MIEKIISGGQTGVDQAGLRIANENGLPLGGWCPKGGLDENGDDIRKTYPSLQATITANPDERTKLNIRDSDGTLIVVPRWPLPETIQDGTRLTYKEIMEQGKPYLIIGLNDTENAAVKILQWIKEHNIKILNIAGPRESSSLGIEEQASALFRQVFSSLKPRARL